MKSEFNTYYILLTGAKRPEDIFGNAKSAEEIHDIYKKISKIIHPDKWISDPVALPKATEAFKLINTFKTRAEERFTSGKYGKIDEIDEIVISTKKNTYTINKIITEGDLSHVYQGITNDGKKVAIKIVKNPRNNDLIDAEKETVAFLHDKSITKDVRAMEHIVLRHLDTFDISQDGISKKGIVYPLITGMVTIEDVIKRYPAGIDVRDAVWMINRVLGALTVSSQAEIVHGAVVPNNVFLDLPTHNGILIGWGFAVKNNTKIKAISSKYKAYYPNEVFDKHPVNTGLDMYMLAKLFLKVVGGNLETNEFPKTIPRAIVGLFRACLLGPKHRTVDPYEFFVEFQEVLKILYGPRVFRPFTLN